jgi:uncharacterized protein (TIGR00369 family)
MADTPAPEALLKAMPFADGLGIALEEASAARVRAALSWAPELCTAGGVLHGGALMTLADTAGALCAFLNLPPGASTSTVESKTNFFRAVRSGTVHAGARPVHAGRSYIAVRTDLHDEDGTLVGQTTQTQAVRTAR